MTWNQYQQLRQAAQQRIRECVAAVQPQGGAGVHIHGRSISLEQYHRPVSPPRPEAWEVVVLGQIKATHYGSTVGYEGKEESHTTAWNVGWRAYRNSLTSPVSSGFWGRATMHDLKGEPPFVESTSYRCIELSLQVRTVTGGLLSPLHEEDFLRLNYRFPVILVLVEYEVVEEQGSTGPIFVDYRLIGLHRIPVGREVTTRTFLPIPGSITFVWPVAMYRAG
jgi:hypothetical protein